MFEFFLSMGGHIGAVLLVLGSSVFFVFRKEVLAARSLYRLKRQPL